ncbi:hybrid sensor histidine kinase/response regulator [Ulvibacterium marinum]|uniref:histidine kinase n=1 Tax=Ulvibacterium marinum TaxID=2419782 RepID=A0A3B0CG26_9FLAO|nr:ATP-binding protein [Ulvibacterium marinum]RKN83159.1 response regulator [Ulvibacterium marinum]
MDKSKNRFTFKVAISYLMLCLLALGAGYFIYSEIQVLVNNETSAQSDTRLLRTGSLVTQIYEAESLSKLALQTKTKKNFNAYAQKIDSVFIEIDSLKQLAIDPSQKPKLDSVKLLLEQKVANSNELHNLRVKNENNRSIDNVLEEFRKMEASFGKLTVHNFEKNPEKLSPYKRKVLEDWVAYLNENIPADTSSIPDSEKIDSVLNASKALLAEAKMKDAKTQRFLAQKENEINRTDLELSQQLRNIVSALEQEVIQNTYNDNLKKQSALRKSIRLAGLAALLGFIVVGLFTFLINRDFWKVQTYRLKLEKEKKYSESLLKSREQLISTVSHDLRTPLNTIQGYAELMENTDLTQKQEGYLKKITSSTGYVGNLVSDLLDFSKLEAGKLKTEKIPFIPAYLIQETAENLQELYTHKKLKLHLEIDVSLQKTVLGDPFRLRQILTNLIGNAFKFTEKGHVKIIASTVKGPKKETVATIAITDTGIGIPKEKQGLIFKEFTQADTDTEKNFGGYGLGLTISKKLTELLNGSLSLESKVGQGSTFILKLPLQITQQKSSSVERKIPDLAANLSILIIDDDTALLGMLRELMESMGITSHIFTNFQFVQEDSPLTYDLVLTDIQMPKTSGFEVLKKLKSGQYKHYKGQPIIAMTGRRDFELETYTSKGFDQVLQKPFSKNELIAVLRTMGVETKKVTDAKTKSPAKEEKSQRYSLDIIHSFLGKNEDAISEVLRTFLRDTQANMRLLTETIKVMDYAQINHVAHRMLPMFRQLRVENCVPVLERLEVATQDSMNASALLHDLQQLKKNVQLLASEMESRWVISPSYSD